jgi:hypothetical protein
MSNLMNNPGDEAERQWWVIEFEFKYEPDEAAWVTTDHASRDCPECRRVVQSRRPAQPKQNRQPKDATNENI